MYVDSGNMILNNSHNIFTKKAQELDLVETPLILNDRELSRAIRDALIAEEGAIKQYESIVDATGNEDIKKILQDIANEERVHVGELQKLLNDLLPDEEKLITEGIEEVKQELGESTEESTEETNAIVVEDAEAALKQALNAE